MSIASEITRITSLRNRIRTRLISLGIINNQSADLEDCADCIDDMTVVKMGSFVLLQDSTGVNIGMPTGCTSVEKLIICLVPKANSLPLSNTVELLSFDREKSSFTMTCFDGTDARGGVTVNNNNCVVSISERNVFFRNSYSYMMECS